MAGKKKNQILPEGNVCKKNDILIMEITDMGAQGEGIGRVEGYTLFVKDAIPGDVARVCVMKTKKRFGYARLLEILTPSNDRVEPCCPVARQCGGCQLQHCSYQRQLLWKQEKVRNCLSRIGGFTEIPMEPIIGMDNPYHYRNKAQFPVGTDSSGRIIAGFYASRTHNIIEHTDCAIQHPCNRMILDTVLEFMRGYRISAYDEEKHTGLVRHILTRVGAVTGEVMVCLVINGESLPYSNVLAERLMKLSMQNTESGENLEFRIKSIVLNKNTDRTNVILGSKVTVLYGQEYIDDWIGDIRYRISPLSFFQVNPRQTKRLYETALEYADLHGGEIVWDLYCGIGTISLFLAQKAAKVFGVEIVPQAVEDAKRNAALNHFDNVEFFAGAAEEIVPQQYEMRIENRRADVVTLDPPRKGCDEKLLQTVVQMEPEKIVYISCNPATLARDLRYLCDRGYGLKRVRVCDMFGQSYHVETVCVLVNKNRKPDDYLRVEIDADKIHEILDKEKAEREAKEYGEKSDEVVA